MKNERIPIPLQRQIFLQSGLALLAMIAGCWVLVCLQDARLMAPFGLAALLLACGAIRLYHLYVDKCFIILRETILMVLLELVFWN